MDHSQVSGIIPLSFPDAQIALRISLYLVSKKGFSRVSPKPTGPTRRPHQTNGHCPKVGGPFGFVFAVLILIRETNRSHM